MDLKWTGRKIVWGVPKELKTVIYPETITGKMRLRFRNMGCATAFFKTDSGIRSFLIDDTGSHWEINLDMEQGRNIRL